MWLAGIFIFLGWIFSVCLHEFGHALVAYWGGDTSVRNKGYLTFNPLKYTHPEMSLIFPIMFMLMGGIALPGGAVYINQSRLRSRWWQSAVSAAGPFANILLILFLTTPFWLGFATQSSENWLWSSLAFLIFLEIFSVLLNLLPVPPLDGYGIIEPWLPQKYKIQIYKFADYGTCLIFGILFFTPFFNQLIGDFSRRVLETIGVSLGAVYLGAELFHQTSTKLVILLILIGVLFLKSQESEWKNLKDVRWYNRGNRPREAKRLFAKLLSNWRQIRFTPTRLVNGWQRFCEDIECTPLRRQLLNLVRNNQHTAERLIDLAKKSHPGKPERWYLEKIIYDLQRGR